MKLEPIHKKHESIARPAVKINLLKCEGATDHKNHGMDHNDGLELYIFLHH